MELFWSTVASIDFRNELGDEGVCRPVLDMKLLEEFELRLQEHKRAISNLWFNGRSDPDELRVASYIVAEGYRMYRRALLFRNVHLFCSWVRGYIIPRYKLHLELKQEFSFTDHPDEIPHIVEVLVS